METHSTMPPRTSSASIFGSFFILSAAIVAHSPAHFPKVARSGGFGDFILGKAHTLPGGGV
jgi:hypothetical protein